MPDHTDASWSDGDLTGDSNVAFDDSLILSANHGNRRPEIQQLAAGQ